VHFSVLTSQFSMFWINLKCLNDWTKWSSNSMCSLISIAYEGLVEFKFNPIALFFREISQRFWELSFVLSVIEVFVETTSTEDLKNSGHAHCKQSVLQYGNGWNSIISNCSEDRAYYVCQTKCTYQIRLRDLL